MTLSYISVCSGIEAASVAWHPLGFKPLWFSETEKFPSAVLAARWPGVINRGDMTAFKEWPDARPDILVGGTPCQSFSVAGLRRGLADPRGSLMLTYLAIAERYQPRWVCWENVPGVLSSNGGRDFGTFLGALEELGYGWAYRVVDAQFVRVDGFTARFPSGGAVCSLSDILEEPGSVPQRYYLSAKACLGILRRAAKRGKELPPMLHRALSQVAEG
jgi:DNA (cytosine-5)-methyltransferase 1